MAAANAAGSKPSSAPSSVKLDSLEGVSGAGGLIPAKSPGACNKSQRGRDHPTVGINEDQQNKLHAELRTIERRFSRRNHSSRITENAAPPEPDLATTTIQKPGARSGRPVRKSSRIRRRIRLRSTAGPTLRDVTTPNRNSSPPGMRRTVTRRKRPCDVCPRSRTLAKSPLA